MEYYQQLPVDTFSRYDLSINVVSALATWWMVNSCQNKQKFARCSTSIAMQPTLLASHRPFLFTENQNNEPEEARRLFRAGRAGRRLSVDAVISLVVCDH